MRTISHITEALNYAANFLVLALMVLVTADVTLRKAFGMPILGSFELSAFTLGAIIWFGFAYTFREKGHVRMDWIVERFSPRARLILDLFSALLALALMALIIWQGTLAALGSYRINEVSSILRLPIGIVRMIVPLGALVVCLELLGELIIGLGQLFKGGGLPSGSQGSATGD